MITAEDISRWAFLSYWGAMLFILIVIWLVILWKLKSGHRWWIGGLATVLVVSSFSLPIFKSIQKDKQKVVVKNEKYLAAKAVFDERCKDAGYKIYKTVEDVEGVTLLKVWPDRDLSKGDLDDQMWEYAGLPRMFSGQVYIEGFLYWRIWDLRNSEYKNHGNGALNQADLSKYKNEDAGRYINVNSYQYVDVLENGEYQRYQYLNLFDLSPDNSLTNKQINKPSRYTIDFENPVIPEDRKWWIATTKATIKDSQTNELLAEANWYTMHGGQGIKKYSTTGIWDRAISCPGVTGQYNPIQNFTLSVLKPKKLPQEPAAQTASDAATIAPSPAQPN